MRYSKRNIEQTVLTQLKHFSAIGITGPRQSGKSTMLRHLLPDYQYVTFDDYKVMDFIEQDPEGFIELYSEKAIFDEVQKAPEIFNLIKIKIDNDRSHLGRFVLTGSSQFSFMKKISESLAGRIGLLSMLPFEYSELPADVRADSIYRGSYPELALNHFKNSESWYSSYLETYLMKDLQDVIRVTDQRDFKRLIKLLASNASQELNYSTYANDIGITVQTVKRWVSALEASYILFLVEPYHNNFGKRIVKSPKVYFYDTGLLSYLLNISSENEYSTSPLCGAIFENYVVSNVVKHNYHSLARNNIFFLRTNDKSEVDLIVDHKSHVEFVEIKHSSSFKRQYFKHIEKFISDADQGVLVYQGEEFQVAKNMKAENVKEYLLAL